MSLTFIWSIFSRKEAAVVLFKIQTPYVWPGTCEYFIITFVQNNHIVIEKYSISYEKLQLCVKHTGV